MSSTYDKVCLSITGKITYVESEDSDYEPPGDSKESRAIKRKAKVPPTRRRKRKEHKPPSRSKSKMARKNSLRSHSSASATSVHNFIGNKSDDDISSPWEFLPVEILSKIFGYVVTMEGSAWPCLKDMRRVCRNWSSVANMPHLWTHMSFTPKLIPDERKFKAKYKTQDIFISDKFHYTHTCHFARLKDVASTILKEVSDCSGQIKDLHAENCRLGDALISVVKSHGRSLRKISIKQCHIAQSGWRNFLSGLGENLKLMEVVCLDQRPKLCIRSLNHLKNLTELKLQYIADFDMLCINDLAMLQVLHLKDTCMRLRNVKEFNHPKIEDVDFSFESRLCVGNDTLVEMLHNCHELRRLSLRGRYVSIKALCSNLQLCNRIVHLDVTVDDPGQGDYSVGSLIHSIGSSLRELHIDKYTNLEESFQVGKQYHSAWKSLQIVSMQRTNIREQTLLSYLNNSFCEMKILNVSTCRELPRGCKRMWENLDSLRALLEKSKTLRE